MFKSKRKCVDNIHVYKGTDHTGQNKLSRMYALDSRKKYISKADNKALYHTYCDE